MPDVVDEGSIAAARVQQVELTALPNSSSLFPNNSHACDGSACDALTLLGFCRAVGWLS